MWGVQSDERSGLQLEIVSLVFVGSESRGTQEHILLSQFFRFPQLGWPEDYIVASCCTVLFDNFIGYVAVFRAALY
jgi:hypothetical protein